jgi:hypothetical protein
MLVPRREKPLEYIIVNIGIACINPPDIIEIHPPPSYLLLGRTAAAIS